LVWAKANKLPRRSKEGGGTWKKTQILRRSPGRNPGWVNEKRERAGVKKKSKRRLLKAPPDKRVERVGKTDLGGVGVLQGAKGEAKVGGKKLQLKKMRTVSRLTKLRNSGDHRKKERKKNHQKKDNPCVRVAQWQKNSGGDKSGRKKKARKSKSGTKSLSKKKSGNTKWGNCRKETKEGQNGPILSLQVGGSARTMKKKREMPVKPHKETTRRMPNNATKGVPTGKRERIQMGQKSVGRGVWKYPDTWMEKPGSCNNKGAKRMEGSKNEGTRQSRVRI